MMREQMQRIWDRLLKWHQGVYVPPPPNDPNSSIVIISAGHYDRPLLARFIDAACRFWLDHWKWIITTSIAIVALVLYKRS